MTTLHLRTSGMAGILLALAACGGTEAPAPAPAPAPEAAPADPGLDKQELESGASEASIVPSPMETQKALEAAGIETQLGGLIVDHTFDMAKADVDNAAIRTGVTLADMLLTVKTSDKEVLLARLSTIQAGMKQLNGGSDIDAMITDIIDRVKADSVSRDDLLKELDELSGAVIPEMEFNGNKRVVPLIEAGSWLEAANLVAKAVKAANTPSAADSLLKQPAVVDYFIKYVKTEGAEKAPEAVTQKLEESLTTLKNLAIKSEALGAEDIDSVIKATDDVLALL